MREKEKKIKRVAFCSGGQWRTTSKPIGPYLDDDSYCVVRTDNGRLEGAGFFFFLHYLEIIFLAISVPCLVLETKRRREERADDATYKAESNRADVSRASHLYYCKSRFNSDYEGKHFIHDYSEKICRTD